ncbi:GDSL-type esterase/lipase family protein [Flavihumibacter rivuli]|uniref:GDSL-type esterase/lipase family protein n=1 Tax=Flavihumibacter rivuli TaxID=2838156 RepID=UPI001BDE1FAB|nr:GDSL-type esterase/lipase family protein [Flavihumibacter rivuli]ULQ56815.1 GDSL-type esterase/lipase family protein [Flavihumibacter rivuli]
MRVLLALSLLINLIFISWNYKRVSEIASRKVKEYANPDWETVSFRLQRDALLKRLPNHNNQVVIIGNSHVQYFEWAEACGNPNVKNRGIGSDVIQGVINRLPDVISDSTRTLIIEVGINDLAKGKSPEYLNEKIVQLIRVAKSLQPSIKVVINSIFPTSNLVQGTKQPLSPLIIKTNEFYRKAAEQNDAVYVDVFSKLGDENGLNEKYHPGDFLHLNADGYEVWLKELMPYLKQ